MAADESWAGVAWHSRGALALLGYRVPLCLPGEPAACGAGWALHAVAFLTSVKAVADHQLGHLGVTGECQDAIYRRVLAELEGCAGCSGPGTG